MYFLFFREAKRFGSVAVPANKSDGINTMPCVSIAGQKIFQIFKTCMISNMVIIRFGKTWLDELFIMCLKINCRI